MIGFFVNTLALRARLEANPSFEELVRQLRERLIDVQQHQDVPFEMLVERLQPERDLSRTPLVQVMFAYQNVPMSELKLEELAISPFGLELGASKFDLTVALAEAGDRLTAAFEYNTDIFDEATVNRIARHYENLLSSAVTDPLLPVLQLNLLEETERQQLVREWGSRQARYDSTACLHRLFEAQVEISPFATALVCGGAKMNYEELNVRANQLAHYLLQCGAGPETLVGIFLERSIEVVVAILGILKAGGAYLPMDVAYPKQRLSYMISDSGVKIVLTSEQLKDQLASESVTAIGLDGEWETIAKCDRANPVTPAVPANLAYVIYTSGSTGNPKGSLITHENVARLLDATEHWFRFDENDVWTLFHSYAFDFSVWELWGALRYGGSLVIVPFLVSRSPEAFYELLSKERVTVLNQTPSAFRQIMQAEERTGVKDLALRYVIFGGEALELQSLAPWFDRHGGEYPLLINMYGITETTVHVTYRPITAADLDDASGSVIGVQIPDLELYLLDDRAEPAPIGVRGEIHVGGAGLARGYLNRPALTAERFIPNPFSDSPGARLYRSGDLGRYLGDGDVEYFGRIDHQVKIRGFRIELGEIESVLNQCSIVREGVVLMKSAGGDPRLIAYVVTETGGRISVTELRDELKQKLPEYMVPSAFVWLDAMPLTENGKVDRKKLLQLEEKQSQLDGQYAAPATPEEEVLAAIWEDVLGVERVGVDDNFFALGGDSIRSVQVISKARDRGLGLTIQQLFQHQTIRGLASHLTSLQSEAALQLDPFSLVAEDGLTFPPGVEDAYPLTMLQAGMLFHSALDSQSAVYHNVAGFHLRARFDAEAIRRAAQSLIDRHPVLRTSFNLGDYSEPLQLVHGEVEVPLEIDDLTDLTPEAQQTAIDEWTEREKHRHFDWSRPPLARFHVHLRSDSTFQFSLTEHHAILDGWSVASLLSELFETYTRMLDGEPSSIEAETANTFRDFVALEKRALDSTENSAYWTNKLSNAPVTTIPRLSRVSGNENHRTALVKQVPVSIETSDGLKRLARKAGTPIKSVLLAAHLKALSFVSGQDEVTTGLVSHGRPQTAGAERALGLFLNTVPFRRKLNAESWIDLAREIFEAEREMLPFRYYPMARLQRDLGTTLFETDFNFTHFHVLDAVQKSGGVEVIGGTGFADTNLTLCANFSLDLANSRVMLSLNGDGAVIEENQMRKLVNYYSNTLDAMASETPDRCDSLSLLSDAEREQIVVEWNDTRAEYDSYLRLHDLFERQVERTPNATAVIFEEQRLSYRELNSRANHLARRLRSAGAGPESIVGVLAERSLEMVIGVLATLKAGAAYLPLDPFYPPSRLAHMIEDSRSTVLLAQERLLDGIPEHGRRVICLDTCSDDLDDLDEFGLDNSNSGVLPDNPAYVIYTSGSTGNPKGVLISHRAICNHMLWMQSEFPICSEDRVLQKTPFSFDASVWEFYAPLVAGGTLVMARPSKYQDPAYLAEVIKRDRVTVLQTVPSLLRMLIDEPAFAECNSLERVFCGGEALTGDLRDAFFALSKARLINLYGPTEATIDAAFFECPREATASAVPIGRPIANMQAYILGADLQPVPAGSTGELYVGGVDLARGYIQAPEQTSDRFIPNPFSSEPGARLYRTGDLARYLDDGNIEFLGRSDHQVKIRGFRIELGEIEAVLKQDSMVTQCVVTADESHAGDTRLVAYVVSENQDSGLIDRLEELAGRQLPSHMIPSAIMALDAMPLTPNGKIDRRALPAPDADRPRLRSEYVAPTGELQQTLVRVWEDVLNVRPIGINDNFFDLGGHSVLAVRLNAVLEKAIGRRIPLALLLQAPTVDRLADAIGREDSKDRRSLVAMNRGGALTPFFCVHPVGGTLYAYAELARRIGGERPFYGFQSRGLDGEFSVHDGIDAMAEQYVAELREVQSHGPYLLGGWSMGGVVAFEMSRRLRARGEDVRLLVMIDSLHPGAFGGAETPDDQALLSAFARDLGLSGSRLAKLERSLAGLNAGSAVEMVFKEAQSAGCIAGELGLIEFERLLTVFKTNLLAVSRYRPEPYDGEVVLIKSDDGGKLISDYHMGWSKAAPNMSVKVVPGDHYSILKAPCVGELSETLAACLDRAGAGETLLMAAQAVS